VFTLSTVVADNTVGELHDDDKSGGRTASAAFDELRKDVNSTSFSRSKTISAEISISCSSPLFPSAAELATCSLCVCQICAECDEPMDRNGDRALPFCENGPVSRGNRRRSLMWAFSEEKTYLLSANAHERSPTSKGGKAVCPADQYFSSPEACEGAGLTLTVTEFKPSSEHAATATKKCSRQPHSSFERMIRMLLALEGE
jgi:hypothetical protein